MVHVDSPSWLVFLIENFLRSPRRYILLLMKLGIMQLSLFGVLYRLRLLYDLV